MELLKSCCTYNTTMIQSEFRLCQPINGLKEVKPIIEAHISVIKRNIRSSSKLSTSKMPSLKGDSPIQDSPHTRPISITIKPIKKVPLETLLSKVELCIATDKRSKSSFNVNQSILHYEQQSLSNKSDSLFLIPSDNSQFRYVPSYFKPQVLQQQKFDVNLATALAKAKCEKKSRTALKTKGSLLEAEETTTSISGILKTVNTKNISKKRSHQKNLY